MKRLFFLILALCVLLCGCKQSPDTTEPTDTVPPTVVVEPTEDPTVNSEPTTFNVWETDSSVIIPQLHSSIRDVEDYQVIVTLNPVADDIFTNSEYGNGYNYYTIDKEDVTFDESGVNLRLVKTHSLIGHQNDLYHYVIAETKTDESNYDGIKEINLYFTGVQMNDKKQNEIFEIAKLFFGDCAAPLVYSADLDGKTYSGETVIENSNLFLSELIKSEHCDYFIEREISFNSRNDYDIRLSLGIAEKNVQYKATREQTSYDSFEVNMADSTSDVFGSVDPFDMSTFGSNMFKKANYGYDHTEIKSVQFTTVNIDNNCIKKMYVDYVGHTAREYHVASNYLIAYTISQGKISNLAIESNSSTYLDPLKYDAKATHTTAVTISGSLLQDNKIFAMPFNPQIPGFSAFKTTKEIAGVDVTAYIYVKPIGSYDNRSTIEMSAGYLYMVAPDDLLDPWNYYDFE